MEAYSQWASAPELPLGGFMPSDDPVQVRDIQGIGPVKADITSTQSATGRGELPQGVSTGKRNIVLTLGLNPNWQDQTISSLRRLLYAYFMPEQWCKLRFFSDDMPTVDIEGDVESFEPNIFSQDPEIQISILCLKPDFIDVDSTIYTGVTDDGSTELEFEYTGTVATGIELQVSRTVAVPSYTGLITITLQSPDVQIFAIDPVTIDTLKYFKLNSTKGMRRVQNVAVADGAVTNLLDRMADDAVWPELKPGQNVISVAAAIAGRGQAWTLAYYNRFGGL